MDTTSTRHGRPSPLVDTPAIYGGDNLKQLPKLPPACIDLICIYPQFKSNRNYEALSGEAMEKRASENCHESARAYIDHKWRGVGHAKGYDVAEGYR